MLEDRGEKRLFANKFLMKRVDKLSDELIYAKAREIVMIGNEAVRKAKEENQKVGIPEYFIKKGKLYFLLSSGEISMEPPAIML